VHPSSKLNYYPVFLNLKAKKTVVVGGGKVAERKVLSLIKTGADVTVISLDITRRLLREKTAKRIGHIQRAYKKGDLKGAFLVVAATNSPDINRKISAEAPALVNVVDVPLLCNCITPSIVKKGDLTIAISTGGTSPAFSKAIRKELEKQYGNEFSSYLRFIKKVRAEAMASIKEKNAREKFLKGLASEKILDSLRKKGLAEVRKSILQKLMRLKASGN